VSSLKAWIFYAAILPSFIVSSQPVAPQLAPLLSLLLGIEFVSLLIYATGGHGLRSLLKCGNLVRAMTLPAAAMVIFLGIKLVVWGWLSRPRIASPY
jgi:homoserine/homoserine lactone efflux protein